MNLTCPIDNKDDSIQKVSAVVTSGQSTGTFSGPTGGIVSYDRKLGGVIGHTNLEGGSTSQLAALLTPPQKPVEPHGFGGWWIILWMVPSLASMFTAQESNNNDILTVIVWFLVLILLLWWQYVNKDHMKDTYAIKKPQWDKAMLKWNRLYYCHKHDIVFDPENRESCSPSSLNKFLYKSIIIRKKPAANGGAELECGKGSCSFSGDRGHEGDRGR